jgi:hypothetical protein
MKGEAVNDWWYRLGLRGCWWGTNPQSLALMKQGENIACARKGERSRSASVHGRPLLESETNLAWNYDRGAVSEAPGVYLFSQHHLHALR